jgi:hypothetical protein
MKIREALQVEGTDQLAVLCYGVFSKASIDAAALHFDRLGGRSPGLVHILIDDDWPNGLLLNEISVPEDSDVAAVVRQPSNECLRLKAARQPSVCMTVPYFL